MIRYHSSSTRVYRDARCSSCVSLSTPVSMLKPLSRSFQVENSLRLAPPERRGAGVAEAGSFGRVAEAASWRVSVETAVEVAAACVAAIAARRSSRWLAVSACWRINSVKLSRAAVKSFITFSDQNAQRPTGLEPAPLRAASTNPGDAPRTTRLQSP